MQRSYVLILGVSAWANILIHCTEAQEITKLILLINVSLDGEGYLRVETPILKKIHFELQACCRLTDLRVQKIKEGRENFDLICFSNKIMIDGSIK